MNNLMEADIKSARDVNPYELAMANIGGEIALREIRKVIRDSKTNDGRKLKMIIDIVHSFEKDMGKEG